MQYALALFDQQSTDSSGAGASGLESGGTPGGYVAVDRVREMMGGIGEHPLDEEELKVRAQYVS